jgi:hypothetical protein
MSCGSSHLSRPTPRVGKSIPCFERPDMNGCLSFFSFSFSKSHQLSRYFGRMLRSSPRCINPLWLQAEKPSSWILWALEQRSAVIHTGWSYAHPDVDLRNKVHFQDSQPQFLASSPFLLDRPSIHPVSARHIFCAPVTFRSRCVEATSQVFCSLIQDVLAHYSLPELFNGRETSFWLAIAQQIAGSGE